MYGITTAETSHTDQITRRQKQYILTMLVRVVSILVVVCVPAFSWPVKVGLCLLAAIIPYVAVVRANAGSGPEKDPTNLLVGPPPRDELGAAQRGLPQAGEQTGFIKAEFFVKDESANGAAQASTANGYRRREPLNAAAPSGDPLSGQPLTDDLLSGAALNDPAANQNPDRPSPAR